MKKTLIEKHEAPPKPPLPPKGRIISEGNDTPPLWLGIGFIIIFGFFLFVGGMFFHYMESRYNINHPIVCIDGFKYRIDKETKEKVNIILIDSLPVECKE
jgi:hypothetical protein